MFTTILFVSALVCFGLVIAGFVIRSQMSPEQRKEFEERSQWGELNEKLLCPHCQHRGLVRSKRVARKKGVSGAKATGALLTAGTSVLVTGLSRKEDLTQAHCGECNSTWDF